MAAEEAVAKKAAAKEAAALGQRAGTRDASQEVVQGAAQHAVAAVEAKAAAKLGALASEADGMAATAPFEWRQNLQFVALIIQVRRFRFSCRPSSPADAKCFHLELLLQLLYAGCRFTAAGAVHHTRVD